MAAPPVTPIDATKVSALSGVSAPIRDERDAGRLPVTGRLPEDLHGVYLRNGPNPRYPPIGSYDYPFDGDAMVHAIWFSDGEARYRNRFVHTREMAVEDKVGHALWGGLLSGVHPDPADIPPDLNPRQKVRPFINALRHAGRYYACSEAQPWYEITGELETVGLASFGGDSPQLCAHPRLDATTNEMVVFNYSVATPPFFSWGILGPDGRFARPMEAVEEIDVPLMMHDFVITERYAVFFFHPLVFNVTGKYGDQPLDWQPHRGTRIAVVPRDPAAGTARWIDTDAFWVWHYANAFEDGDDIVADFPRWTGFGIVRESDTQVHVQRCRIDPAAGTVSFETLDDRVTEFPRIDDRLTGRRHGAFTVSAWSGEGSEGDLYDTLLRVEPDTSAVQERRFGDSRIGEAIFAPRGSGELGDGYVLTYVYTAGEDTTDLLVLDATDITAEPAATVHLPFRVPTGLHGNWIPTI